MTNEPPAGLAQGRQPGAHEPEHRLEVDAHDLGPALVGGLGDRAVAEAPPAHPDRVDDAVEPAERARGVRHGPLGTARQP